MEVEVRRGLIEELFDLRVGGIEDYPGQFAQTVIGAARPARDAFDQIGPVGAVPAEERLAA